MTQHEEHFDEFAPHTLLKHAILDSYIVAWGMKLLLWKRAGNKLAIVDAFAGRGRDGQGSPGSPLIAAERAFEVMRAAEQLSPGLDPKVYVFAIEARKKHYDALVAEMEPFRERRPDLIFVLRGELADHVDTIIKTVGAAPSFYFLDPFGIKGLDATTYSKALRGPHNELFALFADIGANRLHGLITASRASAADQVQAILWTPSLFPEYDTADVATAEAMAAQTNEALDASIPASRRHLTRALGNEEWLAELEQVPPQARPDAFLKLFQLALLRSSAQQVLAVPMRNEAGQRVYSLVHASKSAVGFITMKEAVTTGLNQSRLPAETISRVRADLSVDMRVFLDLLRNKYRGATIPWAAERVGLKDMLLRTTPLFNFQCEALKEALRSRYSSESWTKGRLRLSRYVRVK